MAHVFYMYLNNYQIGLCFTMFIICSYLQTSIKYLFIGPLVGVKCTATQFITSIIYHLREDTRILDF